VRDPRLLVQARLAAPIERKNMGYPGEFELLVLLAILRLGDDAYGVTIREELEAETSRTLTLGTVYKTLGRLEGKGYLETRVGPPTQERGGRRKKLYNLTEVGREVAQRSLADLRRMMRGLEPELDLP
jgi:DNA-binding PadR family transcriptional regulator